MLAAERQCSRNPHQRQYWSPTQRKISRTYSYWKQKANMATKKLFLWNHLNQLCKDTDITEQEHAIIDISIINKNKKETRAKWCSCKKWSIEIRKKFLRERALFMASKMRSTEKKALKAISKAEESRLQQEVEEHILARNRRPAFPTSTGHPLFHRPDTTRSHFHPQSPQLDQFLDGSFLQNWSDSAKLSENEKQWIDELKKL